MEDMLGAAAAMSVCVCCEACILKGWQAKVSPFPKVTTIRSPILSTVLPCHTSPVP